MTPSIDGTKGSSTDVKGGGWLWEENREAGALWKRAPRVSDRRQNENRLLGMSRGMAVLTFREQFIMELGRKSLL